MVVPLMALPPTPVDLPVIPPMAPTPMEEDVTLPVVQAPSLLGGDGGHLEVVSVKVENIPTPSDEAFMMEAIIPSKRVSVEATDSANLSKGVPGTTNMLATNPYVGMINTTSPPMIDPPAMLIGTTFGITN